MRIKGSLMVVSEMEARTLQLFWDREIVHRDILSTISWRHYEFSTNSAVRTRIHAMRKKGIPIESACGGRNGFYRLNAAFKRDHVMDGQNVLLIDRGGEE